MAVSNTLAYHDTATSSAAISFIIQAKVSYPGLHNNITESLESGSLVSGSLVSGSLVSGSLGSGSPLTESLYLTRFHC